jgi:adenosylmethionine-8-amino-7-oxononanoate aminotransferase
MREKLEKFKILKNVKEVRILGMVGVVELQGYVASQRIGLEVYKYGLKNGVLIRPLGNVIYFMPPYIISYEEMDKMFDVTFEAINLLKNI